MKNEQLAKLAKRAELPRVKREYASNCRAPIWHRVEVGRAQLDRVKQARVKKDAPKWTDSHHAHAQYGRCLFGSKPLKIEVPSQLAFARTQIIK